MCGEIVEYSNKKKPATEKKNKTLWNNSIVWVNIVFALFVEHDSDTKLSQTEISDGQCDATSKSKSAAMQWHCLYWRSDSSAKTICISVNGTCKSYHVLHGIIWSNFYCFTYETQIA